jgi:hypothetical protein
MPRENERSERGPLRSWLESPLAERKDADRRGGRTNGPRTLDRRDLGAELRVDFQHESLVQLPELPQRRNRQLLASSAESQVYASQHERV